MRNELPRFLLIMCLVFLGINLLPMLGTVIIIAIVAIAVGRLVRKIFKQGNAERFDEAARWDEGTHIENPDAIDVEVKVRSKE